MLNRLLGRIQNDETILWCLFVVLLFPALFINLGNFAIMMDEPTRALVAMEMMFSDNFLVSTIQGEYYYNKPPLYNWILVLLFSLTQDFSEWMVRLPAVVSLLGFGASIYVIKKHYLGKKIAFLTAVTFITCGRMLTLSSFIGHIDIFYSWLTWLSFIAMYHFSEKEEWFKMFLLTYFIAAITFLSKGLPSIVFQGISILFVLGYRKQWKRLFSWQHILSGLMFLAVVGIYFFAYYKANPDLSYFSTLWDQSSQRTPLQKSVWESVAHFLAFPFEVLMHILPWGLLVLFCANRTFWKGIRAHPFLRFTLLLLFFNILIYWISPETRARYLFMLFPILMSALVFGYEQYKEVLPKFRIGVEGFFFWGSLVLALAFWVLPFADRLPGFFDALNVDQPEVLTTIPFALGKVAIVSFSMLFFLFLFRKIPGQRIIIMGILLLCIRLIFNWFALPHRDQTGKIGEWRDAALTVADITQGEPLFLLHDMHFDHDLTYYISRERGEILRHRDDIVPGSYYLCLKGHLSGGNYTLHNRFFMRHEHTEIFLVTFNE